MTWENFAIGLIGASAVGIMCVAVWFHPWPREPKPAMPTEIRYGPPITGAAEVMALWDDKTAVVNIGGYLHWQTGHYEGPHIVQRFLIPDAVIRDCEARLHFLLEVQSNSDDTVLQRAIRTMLQFTQACQAARRQA